MSKKTLSCLRSRFARLAVAVVGLSAGTVTTAVADFNFNPSGGAFTPAYSITGLQYAGGNALAKNSISGGQIQNGSTFTIYFQTHLSGLVGPNAPAAIPGLNSSFQITLVASITETVTSLTTNASGQTATFALSSSRSDRINIYENNAVVFNDAAGTGFTAGTLIASLTPSALPTSTFTDTTAVNGGTKKFNLTGAGNGQTATSEQGSGSTNVTANVTPGYNPSFFQPPSGIPLLNSSIVNLGVNPIFDTISPSLSFTDPLTGTTFAPNIGSNNGTSGPDFQLQVSGFVQSFTVVPEPASVALTLIGFAGVGLGSIVARRRRATV